MPTHSKKWFVLLRKWVLGLVTLIALIGLLHLPFARKWLRQVGGCPVAPVDAANYDLARKQAMQDLRGPLPAPTRLAAGFELDVTTRADVQAWAKAGAIQCAEFVDGAMLRCQDLPAQLPVSQDFGSPAGGINEAVFGFDAAGKLVNLTLTRVGLTGAEAEQALLHWQRVRTQQLGDAPHIAGLATAEYLNAAPFRTCVLQNRFSNYFAEATATHFPGRGMRVQEQYVSGTL